MKILILLVMMIGQNLYCESVDIPRRFTVTVNDQDLAMPLYGEDKIVIDGKEYSISIKPAPYKFKKFGVVFLIDGRYSVEAYNQAQGVYNWYFNYQGSMLGVIARDKSVFTIDEAQSFISLMAQRLGDPMAKIVRKKIRIKEKFYDAVTFDINREEKTIRNTLILYNKGVNGIIFQVQGIKDFRSNGDFFMYNELMESLNSINSN